MEVIEFFGRLHPLFLHLPIGILAIAFAMECLGRKEKYASLLPAVGFALQVGMLSAIIAAISGYLLSLEGGYEETMLSRHQWLGIGTAVVSIIVFLLHKRKNSPAGKKLFLPFFGGLMLLMGITGHIGGSLTHGSDFLTAPFSAKKEQAQVVISNMDSAMIFQDLVQPIFKQKCVSCHNESKIKGELLMSTVEGLKKGGKNGAFLKAGVTNNSLFLQRVHLPLEEKEHMPPKGKRQLTEDEISLLSWWVEEGAHYDKPVAAVNTPENIQAILDKYMQTDQSVFALQVEPPKESDLNRLRQSGASITIVSEEKPFVTASFNGKQDLSKSTLKQLQNISEQLIELDLGNTNMSDELLSYLSELPHLQKLFLQKTKVTGKKLDALKELHYLEYLNLYDTPLEDLAIAPIAQLTNLKNLYLWKTNLSTKAIKQLKNDRPTLMVNTGINKDIFGEAKLKAPAILVDKDIFEDSISVSLKMDFKGVNLFYTLDGTLPDSTSKKYTEPLLLTKTSNIQAIAKKEGWTTSPIAQRTVVRAKYKIANILLEKQPHGNYKADGGPSLINRKKGTTNFTEGEWLGYEKAGLTATLDMGTPLETSSVSVSALESTGSYIFFPKNLKVSVSTDGKKFQPVADQKIPIAAGPEPPSMKNFVLDFEAQKARFVKVEIESNLVNPNWHPAPGASCWIFIDEIMVE